MKKDGENFGFLLSKLAPGIKIWKVFDKDDRSDLEIEELKNENIYVLSRRDIESFLWDDEVLECLCQKQNKIELFKTIKEKKQQQISSLSSRSMPVDDIKAITDNLYIECKKILGLTGCGNSAEVFSIEHLAPLIQPGMRVYEELAATVLAPLRKNN